MTDQTPPAQQLEFLKFQAPVLVFVSLDREGIAKDVIAAEKNGCTGLK